MKEAGKNSIASYYPDFRDKQLKTVYGWMECRQKSEKAEGLWRVHDKLYDLSEYLDRHPGGREWLEITKGTDVTELFELHHLQLTAENLLPKFYVRDAKDRRSYKLTFKEDGFFRTLKRRARNVKLDRSPERLSKLYSGVVLFLIFSCGILSVKTGSTIIAALTGLFVAWAFFVGHNFLHQKHSWRKIMINFSLMSYHDVRISHIFSHHVYTNTFNDLEAVMTEPIFSWFPLETKTITQRYLSWIYSWFIFAIVPQLLFVQRVAITLFREQKIFRKEDFIPLLLPISMYWFGVNDLVQVFKTWNLIMSLGGICFGIIGITVGHHTPETMHEGDDIDKSMDFGIFQLDTVVDRKDVKASQFLVLTHLGEHTLHHFFPTLDHGLLPQLNGVFIETCKEFDTELREFSWYKLLVGHHEQLARVKTLTVEERRRFR